MVYFADEIASGVFALASGVRSSNLGEVHVIDADGRPVK
jgi:hypothetical protein